MCILDLNHAHLRASSQSEGTYVLQALLPGNLREYLNTNNLSLINRIEVIIACAKAINELHCKHHIAHNDLKDDNFQYCVINKKAYPIDLDSSTPLDATNQTKIMNQEHAKDAMLFWPYLAPERATQNVKFNNQNTVMRPYSSLSDLYAFAGFILIVLKHDAIELRSIKQAAFYATKENRLHKAAIAPYKINKQLLKSLGLNEIDTTNIIRLVKLLSNNDYLRRPKNLNITILFFEKLLKKLNKEQHSSLMSNDFNIFHSQNKSQKSDNQNRSYVASLTSNILSNNNSSANINQPKAGYTELSKPNVTNSNVNTEEVNSYKLFVRERQRQNILVKYNLFNTTNMPRAIDFIESLGPGQNKQLK